jgi:NADH-quinone oxidoreductase subunit C
VSSTPPADTPPAEEQAPPPDPIVARLAEVAPEAVAASEEAVDCLTLTIPRERLVEVCQALRDDPALAFVHLSDVTAVDRLDLGEEPRFAVVYHLLSRALRRRLRLRVLVDEDDPVVPTITGIWPTADWHERETNDMFGIGFAGHPDPRRILLPDDFEGHPLRRDFPLGSEEVAFSHNQDSLYRGYPNPNEGHPPFKQ